MSGGRFRSNSPDSAGYYDVTEGVNGRFVKAKGKATQTRFFSYSSLLSSERLSPLTHAKAHTAASMSEAVVPSGTTSDNPPQEGTPSFSLNRLKGKVALITGGANKQGFGAAISRRFAAEGAKILIGDLDGDGAANTAKDIGNGAVGVQMDVTSEEGWKNAIEKIMKEFGKVDVVVNNVRALKRRTCDVEDLLMLYLSKSGWHDLQEQAHGGCDGGGI